MLGPPRNTVVLPYVSMHESTKGMVAHFVQALVERGVRVEQFNLVVTDIGKLAMALVDAATIVAGTPTIPAGLHPYAVYSALGKRTSAQNKIPFHYQPLWAGGKTLATLAGMTPNLEVEVIEPVLYKRMLQKGILRHWMTRLLLFQANTRSTILFKNGFKA